MHADLVNFVSESRVAESVTALRRHHRRFTCGWSHIALQVNPKAVYFLPALCWLEHIVSACVFIHNMSHH